MNQVLNQSIDWNEEYLEEIKKAMLKQQQEFSYLVKTD
jgi:hypothetical protein